MKAILNGTLVLPDSTREGAILYDRKIIDLVSNDEAKAAADETLDARGLFITPGLVDTHVHGVCGVEVLDGTEDAIRTMAHELLSGGVTSFLATTETVAWDRLETAFEQIRIVREESRRPGFSGAEILGCHAEGPFLNPVRKGAMQEAHILPPDAEKVLPYADVIRVLTLSPEMPGADACIRTLTEKTDIRLSMGHTDATYEEAMHAFDLGVTRATHLFNAMPSMHHRAPGPVCAALTRDVFTELIADTYHVDRALFPLVARLKGDRLVLITDTGRFAGMPDGTYAYEGATYILKGLSCRFPDGTITGSVMRLNMGVRNLRDFGHIPFHQAVRAATLSAAASCGADDRKGSLEPGKDADLVVMDGDCRVLHTIVGGETRYTADRA